MHHQLPELLEAHCDAPGLLAQDGQSLQHLVALGVYLYRLGVELVVLAGGA